MPRRRMQADFTSGFRQVQQQARALLANLRREIRNKEIQLGRLKEEESRLATLAGRARAAGNGAAREQGRINWRAVLGRLPRQFKASDVRSVRGLRSKRPSEIFAAITRWIEAGLVKRRARGLYERG
jgi:hypothetical protein